MNHIFKILSLSIILCYQSGQTNAQGFEPYPGMTTINFGIGASTWGIPIYGGMDFGISDHISLGPRISYRTTLHSSYYRYNIFNLGFRGNYHFANHIDPLPEELDLYGGITAGYSIWGYSYDGFGDPDPRSSSLFIAAHAGGRWYFSDNWAANAEGSGGSTFSAMKVGLTYLFD